MPEPLREFRFTRARENTSGLLGFASFLEGRVLLDRIAVRVSAAGAITLSFPQHRHEAGPKYPIVRPIDTRARDEITEQIVAELRRMGWIK